MTCAPLQSSIASSRDAQGIGSGRLLGDSYVPLGDAVYTPSWVAKDMVEWFKPTGSVLDPCRGPGAIYDELPLGSHWCEIKDGKDFFAWSEPVDWIICNPPYTGFRKWFKHSFDVANHVVMLVPVWKAFSAHGLRLQLEPWGGIAEIRHYGIGTQLGFPMANAIGAVYFKRGHHSGVIQQSEASSPNKGI